MSQTQQTHEKNSEQMEDEEKSLDQLENEVPKWTPKQKRTFATLAVADDPLTGNEVKDYANVSRSYVYVATILYENDLIEKITVDGVNKWKTTERGDALAQRFKETAGGGITDIPDFEDEDDEDEDRETDAESDLPFECNVCSKRFRTLKHARMHVNRTKSGKHRGRSAQEPGIITVDQDKIDDESQERYKGMISTEGECTVGSEKEEDVTEKRESGNVTTVGAIDGTGGKEAEDGAQRLREPTVIQNRRVKSTESPDEEVEDESTEETLVGVQLTHDEVFNVLGSDAPESFRRRVFEKVVEGAEDGE